MKFTEVPQAIFSALKQYFSYIGNVIYNNTNYLRTTSIKNLFIDSIKNLLKAAKFTLRLSLKAAAFAISIVLFAQIAPLLVAGLFLPAILASTTAALLLLYSGPPYTLITNALSAITAPFVYVVKNIVLTIIDHLLEEAGIVEKIENRPYKEFFKIEQDDVDGSNIETDLNDLNPSFDTNISADLLSFSLGPIKFNIGSVLRYALDPFNISTHIKKAANFLIYSSGLEGRARYLSKNSPQALEKQYQKEQSSNLAKLAFIKLVDECVTENNLTNVITEPFQVNPFLSVEDQNFHSALHKIATNDELAKLIQEDSKNWFHFINKIIISEEDKLLYGNVAELLLKLSISPYDRDNEGNTAFKGSANNKLDELVREAIHGGMGETSIGLNEEFARIKEFLINSQDVQNESDPSLKANRFMVLEGPPGVGKTDAVKKIMKDNGFILLVHERAAPGDQYVGRVTNRIKEIFLKAKRLNCRVCIFIDEIDVVVPADKAGNHSAHENLSITEFQLQLDGLIGSKVVCIGATNYSKNIKKEVISRFGMSLEFGYPSYEVRKSILEDKFRCYTIKNFTMILERLARMYEGKSPRDLQGFVADVIKKSRQRVRESLEANTNELLLEDFESIHKQFIKSRSNGLDIIYPKINIPADKCDSIEVPHLPIDVLNKLENLDFAFDKNFPNICGNENNNIEGVIFTGFVANQFINTIANYNTKCATIYFNANALAENFEQDLAALLNQHIKAVIVIDNIDHIKDNDKIKNLLLEMSSKGRTLYIMGTTQEASKSHKIWPSIFSSNIKEVPPVSEVSKIKDIIESVFNIARTRGITVDNDIMTNIPEKIIKSLKGLSINAIINMINKTILSTVNHMSFAKSDTLFFSNLQPTIKEKMKQHSNKKPEEIKADSRAKKDLRRIRVRQNHLI